MNKKRMRKKTAETPSPEPVDVLIVISNLLLSGIAVAAVSVCVQLLL